MLTGIELKSTKTEKLGANPKINLKTEKNITYEESRILLQSFSSQYLHLMLTGIELKSTKTEKLEASPK